jgi:SSS family solute:Na+ symporter
MALSDRGITSWAAFTAAAQPHQLHMLRADGDFAWYAMLAGYPVIAIWYWCSDQTIVQRVLGARSEHDAQLGPVLAGFLKILPVFIMAVPGVMAYVLFGDELGSNRDMALSVMIDRLVPTGLKGLITAGLLAALMSTVASALNSTASVVSLDIVKRMRPHTSDRALLATGRVTACVVMALATAWSTQGDRFGGIFEGVNHSIIYLAPPITAVFLYGVFWARGTHEAALATLVVGLILGAVAFVLDFPAFGFGVIRSVAGIPFMLQGACLFVLCSVVYFTVSLRTPPPPEERIRDLCWKTPLAALAAERSAGLADPRLWASVLLAAIVALYVVFA